MSLVAKANSQKTGAAKSCVSVSIAAHGLGATHRHPSILERDKWHNGDVGMVPDAAANERPSSTHVAISLLEFLRAFCAMLADVLQGEDSTHQPVTATGDGTEFKIGKVANITSLATHDVVMKGLPISVAYEMMRAFKTADRRALLCAIGMSERALQHGRRTDRLLDSNASDRLLRLAIVTEQAIDVFGSQQAAERWLTTPATGLGMRKPIDLLQSSAGSQLVTTVLARIDRGVYT
ncbi:antitoxin Xre/MbcA/ParS toxin-binding domain-containing protein [Paraburkholderia sp. B3]|uniref:type II RES/Xre toxin-antitoxin system antitoxin n=1 Tax=Paraburkholderia sp. B3 TaxID=3134791 RepID=UPI0039829C31